MAKKNYNKGTIHYGFGAEYLPNWGLKEALREIYQNFLDYGDYDEEFSEDGGITTVKLTNGWMPENLEYLRIGNSRKENTNAIGHHGEGLKMAFLILLRNNLESNIFTNRFSVVPSWYSDREIGDCFSFSYKKHGIHEAPYSVTFQCPAEVFVDFKENLIMPSDIEYSDAEWGDLVNKPAGNIYSGRLFVTNLKGIGRSYNIRPSHLPLDRDRCVPHAFDVEYATSMILQGSQKLTTKDLSYSDTRYVSRIPETVVREFKPRRVGNNIEFTMKNEKGEQVLLQNENLKATLRKHSFFEKAIAGIKRFLAKQLGVYDLLVQFRDKHLKHNTDALQDFNIILEKVEN